MELKRRLRLGALLTFVPAIPAVLLWSHLRPHHAAQGGMRIEVSLSARELKVLDGDKVVHTYGIAVGRPSHPTPTGSFRTGGIDWNPAWTPPPVGWARNKEYQAPGAPSNPMQGVKIYFEAPYYFIHGTNNPGSIGGFVSYGCIRMYNADVLDLYSRVSWGTTVVVQ